MTDPLQDLRTAWWAKKFEEIDLEIAQLATICRIRLLDPGMIERVLKNVASVCGTQNPAAFAKLRSLVMMHYVVRDKAVDVLGTAEAQRLIDDAVARLHARIGANSGA